MNANGETVAVRSGTAMPMTLDSTDVRALKAQLLSKEFTKEEEKTTNREKESV
jgi:hypothetical protein